MPSLRVLEGNQTGAVFVLAPGDNIIGRGPSNSICLQDRGVSSRHAILTVKGESASVRDVGSTNGVLVNGEKIQVVELHAGDKVLLGASLLEYCVSSSEKRPGPEQTETVEISLDRSEVERLSSQSIVYPHRELGPTAPETLSGLAYLLAMTEDSRGLLEKLAGHLSTHLDADSAFVCLRDNHTAALEIVCSFPSERTGSPLSMSHTTMTRALELGEALLLENAVAEGIVDETASVVALGSQSVIYAPLLSRGIIGLGRAAGHPFAGTDLRLAAVSTHLAAKVLASLEATEDALSRSHAFEGKLKRQHRIVGESPEVRRVFETVERVAPTDALVLICGETGTGKELVAKAIHAHSPRASGPYVPINCAALPGPLLESTLLGHVKGAFTGADEDRVGCFEEADQGTLFLDEVAELTLEAQAKLLRVIEDGVVRKVGGQDDITMDVRLLLATHRDLEHEVREGRFREDLYYRVNVVTLTFPPLRERKSDIPLLAEFFLEQDLTKAQRVIRGFSDEAMQFLRDYFWPGNVRELRNAVARAVILGQGEFLEPDEFGLSIQDPRSSASRDTLESLKEVEREHILRVLNAVGWKKIDAAPILGINRKTLTAKCKEYGLEQGDRA